MKTAVVISTAVSVGCLIAFWLFGLAFNMNVQKFNQAALAPLGCALIGSLILVVIQPKAAKWSAIGIAAPALIIDAFFFFMILSEGHGADWTHLITPLKVIAAVIVGCVSGLLVNRLIQRKRAA